MVNASDCGSEDRGFESLHSPHFPFYGDCHIGMSPSGKAPDFDSGIRRFKSCHPSQLLRGSISLSYDPLAQLAEQLPFKQWVWSSNLQRVTKKEDTPSGVSSFFVPAEIRMTQMQHPGGVLLPPVRKLVATIIFAFRQKCKRISSGSRPERGNTAGHAP